VIQLPALDCHAHIAPDVTADQLARLVPSVVFAVTRWPDEAKQVAYRKDQRIVWGLGVHPSRVARGETPDLAAVRELLPQFALVGEIGLDRRSGNLALQVSVLRQVLSLATDQPVILSVHSNGAVDELLELLEEAPRTGVVLHWFNGAPSQIDRAVRLGCYFSVNAAMEPTKLLQIPSDRLLPETDYPATRRHGGRLPGDTGTTERLLADLSGSSVEDVRHQSYRNLRAVLLSSGAIDRVSATISDLVLLV